VRLTRRGAVVLGAAVAVLGAALVLLASLSAPSGATGSSAPRAIPAHVTVRAGDTLWSIATRLAPQRDPRAEVADLQRINSLRGGALVPGQVLRTG
jgi:LysM repeat protein